MSTIDKDGNIVSLIQSNYAGLRNRHGRARRGLLVPQSRRRASTWSRASPTRSPDRKRPLHTIIPAFMHKGDISHRLRHHGRMEPVAGPRPVRRQRRRFQYERPDGARIGALHQGDLRRLRRADGEPRSPRPSVRNSRGAATSSRRWPASRARWATARPSCATPSEASTSPAPTPAPMAPRFPNSRCSRQRPDRDRAATADAPCGAGGSACLVRLRALFVYP